MADGWLQLKAKSRKRDEPPVRHLLQGGRRICNRWADSVVAAVQDPSGVKCYQCQRILASAERQGQYKDPDAGL